MNFWNDINQNKVYFISNDMIWAVSRSRPCKHSSTGPFEESIGDAKSSSLQSCTRRWAWPGRMSLLSCLLFFVRPWRWIRLIRKLVTLVFLCFPWNYLFHGESLLVHPSSGLEVGHILVIFHCQKDMLSTSALFREWNGQLITELFMCLLISMDTSQ